MKFNVRVYGCLAVGMLLSAAPIVAQEAAEIRPALAEVDPAPSGAAGVDDGVRRNGRLSTRRALIVCGLAGDAEYREQFIESLTQIRSALIDRMGFAESDVRVQYGLAEQDEPVDAFPIHGNATRDEIAAEAKRLTALATAADSTWVIVLGQAYFDGRSVFLNLPDADITHKQFGQLFQRLKGNSTFIISTPASGFYIKPLSRENRIVITSSEADAETNGSIFHLALASAMTDIRDDGEFDVDEDGTVSVHDLYVKTVQNMMDLYYENDPPLIPTEHPQLDDNGDGRGSELQVDYLPMSRGGRSDSKRKRLIRKFRDGKLAASTSLGAGAK